MFLSTIALILIFISISFAAEPISRTELSLSPKNLVVEDTIAYFFEVDDEYDINSDIYNVADPICPIYWGKFLNDKHFVDSSSFLSLIGKCIESPRELRK